MHFPWAGSPCHDDHPSGYAVKTSQKGKIIAARVVMVGAWIMWGILASRVFDKGIIAALFLVSVAVVLAVVSIMLVWKAGNTPYE